MYDETIDDVLNYSEEVNLRDVFFKTFKSNWRLTAYESRKYRTRLHYPEKNGVYRKT